MQTYIKLVCLLGISGSLIVASPVERQQTTCQPDFEYVRHTSPKLRKVALTTHLRRTTRKQAAFPKRFLLWSDSSATVAVLGATTARSSPQSMPMFAQRNTIRHFLAYTPFAGRQLCDSWTRRCGQLGAVHVKNAADSHKGQSWRGEEMHDISDEQCMVMSARQSGEG